MTKLHNLYALESKNEAIRLEAQVVSPKHNFASELANCDFAPEHKVLDAGCGTGLVGRFLASQYPGISIVGIDASHSRILAAKELAASTKNLSFQVSDITQTNLANNFFDRIVCRYVFEHISHETRVAALAEFKRLLKPGGKILIVDFDGLITNLWPTTPTIQRIWSALLDRGIFDSNIGRKIPKYLFDAGFTSATTSSELFNDKAAEIPLMRGRLDGMKSIVTELFDVSTYERFKNELMQILESKESTLAETRFCVTAEK